LPFLKIKVYGLVKLCSAEELENAGAIPFTNMRLKFPDVYLKWSLQVDNMGSSDKHQI
jgi:hypothetical protein